MSDPRRVLFVGHDAGGTIPPVLAVAEAMRGEGHDVTILSQPSVRARAERIGARFAAFTALPDYDRTRTLEEQLERTVPALVGAELGDDLLAIAAATEADVVVVDPNLTGALAAAETLDCRTAVLLHCLHRTFVDHWFGPLWPMLEAPINDTRRRFGVDAADHWAALFEGHDALIAAVPARFDDTPHAGGQQHHGFLVPPPTTSAATPKTEGDDGRETVLVGLSTTYQRHEALLGAIVHALGSLPVRGIVTTGGHVTVDDVPPNVTVTEHADHRSLMATTDVVVTHAGLGTIAVALSGGVPLVCVPIDRDQPLNAARVVALDAGVLLDEHHRRPTDIAAAIEAVLADRRYRVAAGSVAEASRAEGGPASAAAAILGP